MSAASAAESVPDTDARDERAVAAYVERLGDALTEAGMPRLASRVFARLLADDDGRMTAYTAPVPDMDAELRALLAADH